MQDEDTDKINHMPQGASIQGWKKGSVTFDLIAICFLLNLFLKNHFRGLPWWLSGEESTCQRKRHRVHFCSRKIPRVSEQLSPAPHPLGRRSGARELHPMPVHHHERSHGRDTCMMRSSYVLEREQPQLSATREKAHTATKTQHSQKQNK